MIPQTNVNSVGIAVNIALIYEKILSLLETIKASHGQFTAVKVKHCLSLVPLSPAQLPIQ